MGWREYTSLHVLLKTKRGGGNHLRVAFKGQHASLYLADSLVVGSLGPGLHHQGVERVAENLEQIRLASNLKTCREKPYQRCNRDIMTYKEIQK